MDWCRCDKTSLLKQWIYMFSALLTHWGLNKMAISLTIFFICIFLTENYSFWLKFHSNLFLMVQLTTCQHCFMWWLGVTRQQAITWTKVGKGPQCHLASKGHKELIHWYVLLGQWLVISQIQLFPLVVKTIKSITWGPSHLDQIND